MKPQNLLASILVAVVLFLYQQPTFSQTADQFDEPIVNGERSLKFRVGTGTARPDRLEVTVFYSDSRNRLNNLEDTTLSRGKPVLRLDSSTSLGAEFLFPHPDFAKDPNRSLYVRYKALGVELVR
jgi:hypothetical protein